MKSLEIGNMSGTEKSKLKFIGFCKLCEKMNKSSKDKKKAGVILRKFIHGFRQAKDGIEFYPVLRLLLPQLDRDRGAYGLKEHALAQKYIKVLSIPKGSEDAKRLLNFRAPRSGNSGSGDFGEVVYWVIKNRHSGGEELTVDDINTCLDKIADKHAAHEPRAVDDELIWMVQRMSPLEIKWLTRILVKEMKLGIGHKGILKSYHLDAVELYDVSNNLFKICEKLSDPLLRLHEVEVSLFSPFRPMLAERCDVQKVERELTHAPFHYVETKWDGERCQLHFQNGEFKYYTRKGFDYTDSFGANSSVGSLTPRLSKQFKPSVQSCILDGEMMAWNTKYKSFGSKGANIEVKSLRVGSVYQPCLCAFDILYLNGSVLTNKPFKERINILSTVFTPLEGTFVQTTRKVVKTGNDVMKLLNEAIDNREEGIILKRPESVYKMNLRNGGWYKIKPEYTTGAMEDLDLLIIGGYYGEGRRRGLVSQFLLGVAVPSKTPDGDPEQFLAVGRVGSGCTMDELAELGQKLSEHWNKLKARTPPPTCLQWSKEKPDLWIEPPKSVILQIKASEIVYSDAYPVNYSLRFPRIEKVRYDKRWQDCLTVDEFHELRTAASGKLISSHISSIEGSPVKAKRTKIARIIPTVSREYLANDLSNVKQISKVLEGKEICVMGGNNDYSKKDLEAKAVANGGKIVQNPGLSTFFIVTGSEANIRIKHIKDTGRHDVITVDCFCRIIEFQEIVEFRPEDLICMSKSTKERMKLLYDEFGDNYTKPATIDTLKESLKKVKTMGKYKHVDRSERRKLDFVLFNGPSPFSIFCHCTAYFFKYKVSNLADNVGCALKFAAIKFLFMGGKIVESIDDSTSHAVIHSSDIDYLDEIKAINAKKTKKIFVVNEFWIMESWASRSCLDENLFVL